MNPIRRNSKLIVDAYVLAKEIKLAAASTSSRHFDPVWLYERAMAVPEPPDEKERRCSARALIKAGHAILDHARPDLAGETFEKAYLLLNDSKSVMLRAKAMAGVVLCWQRMGQPRSGAAFVARALQRVSAMRGEKAKARQEKQLDRAMEKAKKVKLPQTIKSPTGDYMPRKRSAHTSTLLKSQ